MENFRFVNAYFINGNFSTIVNKMIIYVCVYMHII